jgi:hypothetical protein
MKKVIGQGLRHTDRARGEIDYRYVHCAVEDGDRLASHIYKREAV